MPELRRRQLLKPSDPDARFLKYWWSGEDDLVNGKWVDRMGSGLNWSAGSMVERVTGGYHLGKASGGQYYFDINAPTFSMGHHFKIMIDAEFIRYHSASINSAYLVDFYATGVSEKGVGFSVDYERGGLPSINWKMKGASSNPGITAASYVGTIFPKTDSKNIKVSFAMRDKGNGYDEAWVGDWVNEEVGYAADVPKIEYTSFQGNVFYIGRSLLNSDNYASELIIREIKIYVYD